MKEVPVKGMFQRGKSWWLRYTPAPGATQVRIALGTTNESVAAVLALQIKQGAVLEAPAEYVSEVERYFAAKKASGKLAETTVAMRRTVLMAFARDCGIQRVSQITAEVVNSWSDRLKKGRGKPGDEDYVAPIQKDTSVSYIFHVRAFLRWLVSVNKLHTNPVAKVEIGKVQRSFKKHFEPKEVVRRLILEAPHDDMKFVLFCGFHGGLRKIEIVEASPKWFQLEPSGSKRRGRISLEATETFTVKDKDERTIPLSTEFEEFLRGYLAKLPKDAKWVLQPEKAKGKWRYRYDFRKPFADYMKAQGVKCGVHDMRRSFVSNKLVEDSSLIFKLAKWTGTSVKVLQKHYGHLLADDDDIEAGV